jgi:ParB-like chromosome segregation protein Spo0J
MKKNTENTETEIQEEYREKYPVHPVADFFPMMDEEEYESLRESIKSDGLRDEILQFRGHVVDGRNRLKACFELGLEPKFTEYLGTEEDLEGFIFSRNYHRRHLSKEQKKDLAILLREKGRTQDEIRQFLKISIGTVNSWLKEKHQMDDRETREDALGRNRPRSYNKKLKSEPEETEEEKLERRIQEARDELSAWKESYEDLGSHLGMLLKEVSLKLPHIKLKALK